MTLSGNPRRSKRKRASRGRFGQHRGQLGRSGQLQLRGQRDIPDRREQHYRQGRGCARR